MLRPATLALVLLFSCLTLFSQEPQETLRVSVRLVTVNVRVAQPDGAAVRDLTEAAFRLFEDDREKQISVFEPLTAPLHVALLFDTSASTARDLELAGPSRLRPRPPLRTSSSSPARTARA